MEPPHFHRSADAVGSCPAVNSNPSAASRVSVPSQARKAASQARLFTACTGTQLLVIQHLRRHLPVEGVRDFLLWHPLENLGLADALMRDIIAGAGFADTLDMRDFASLQPRNQGTASWVFESTRRLRRDATQLHGWLAANEVDESAAELWVDDPLHFNVIFALGALRRMRRVKIPHAFNHEDVTVTGWKASLERRARQMSWPKRHLFLPWQRRAAGIDLRTDGIDFDRAYSFDLPSPWAADSIDVSRLISLDAFAATYAALPAALRDEVEAILAPIRAAPRPLVVLLLFGLHDGPGPDLRPIYRKALQRIFIERGDGLAAGSLAVKAHPAAHGREEAAFVDRLRDDLPVPVLPLLHGLNLELMLPQLRPDYVTAGLCGGLPIVRRLAVGRAVALAEMIDLYLVEHPDEREAVHEFLRGIEIW
jgi:hypothetical protein